MAVQIVTDSTADIPVEIARTLGVCVVPLTVLMDGHPHADDDSEPREEFHRRLARAGSVTTSQPAPGQFVTAYREFIARGRSVISVHVSGLLSGTLQSAMVARGLVEGVVDVIDSKTSSMAMGMAVMEAARAAADGLSHGDVLARLRHSLDSTVALFTVGSLRHLERIGRLGRLQSIVGTLLDIKPILHVYDGQLALLDRVRGRAGVVPRVLSLLQAQLPAGSRVRAAISHISAGALAGRLREELEAVYDCVELVQTRAGGVMAAAVGPGSVGVFVTRL